MSAPAVVLGCRRIALVVVERRETGRLRIVRVLARGVRLAVATKAVARPLRDSE